MKSFYIYIAVMAVVMCVFSSFINNGKKKKKRCTRMVRTKS